MQKDWTGNTQATMKKLGASSHSENERQSHDYYATEPKAIKLLLQLEKFQKNIWECSCGELSLSEELSKNGHIVYNTDLIQRCKPIDKQIFWLYR